MKSLWWPFLFSSGASSSVISALLFSNWCERLFEMDSKETAEEVRMP
jgi:hypothetical protein